MSRARLSQYAAVDLDAALPMELWALASAVLDDELPVPRRVAALRRIERARREHHHELARLLVPALHAPPDLAAQVHVALLVLDRSLAVGRGADGRFVASARPISEAHDDGVCTSLPDVGRVVGLDALALLFAEEGDELPPFLAPPERPAPAPYRPSARVLAERAADAARAEHRERLRALGLDPDDLDDDAPPPKVTWVERLRAPLVTTIETTIEQGGARILIDGAIDAGVAHPGAWWADERTGDHRRARRWHLRLERAAPSGEAVQRRERAFVVRRGTVTVRLGDLELQRRVAGRNVVAFIEEERGLVVGLTISWSNPKPPVVAERKHKR